MATFDFSTFPTLRTQRLVLRPLTLNDAEAVFAFRSDPKVQKFNAEPLTEVGRAEELIADLQAEFDRGESVCWGVASHDEDEVIGLFGFNTWNAYHRRSNIGYDLHRSYWGRGVATEAIEEMLRFGFDTAGLNRIGAITIADNEASVRLLERLGFRFEGARREYSWEESDEAFHDSALFGLLRAEYHVRRRHTGEFLTW